MKNRTKLWLPTILAATALTASACGGGGAPSGEPDSGTGSGNGSGEMSGMQGMEETTGMQGMEETTGMTGMEETTEMSDMGGMQGMDMGSMLMDENGEYSDELFIDNMVPHHQAAIEEAEVALDNAERPELRELAQNIVSSQESEIAELQQIKEEEFGTSETPMEMSDEEMEMMGMSMTPEELAEAEPFDLAFLDNMTPHHESAVDMAQVALDNSDNPDIQRIAQEIVTAQQSEIEQMQQWREEWYPNS
ncbi:DUF305 domain-containing protein [Rubrobacter indicoceani]|uniref:DUF305 domain-containing protein n=1 Tax=Rubrobacter indicoceani TaxID=2051957 RepID=UPI001F09E61E